MKLFLIIVTFCSLIFVGFANTIEDVKEEGIIDGQIQPEELSTIIEDDDTVQVNFVKVLSAILIRKKPVPKEVRGAVRSMLKEILNNSIEKYGYKTYLQTSMLRVYNSKPDVQMISMLNILESQSPTESPLSKAAKILIDWFKTPEGKKFLEEIIQYVRSLFQRINQKIIQRPKQTQPGSGGSNNGLNDNKPKPSTLPGDITGIDIKDDNGLRAHLARSRVPNDFHIRNKRSIKNKEENELVDEGLENYLGPSQSNNNNDRRRPGRPGGGGGGGGGPPRRPIHEKERPPQSPPRRPGHGESRPPHGGYPDDNHIEHYPEQPRPPHGRPGKPRPPQGYPDESRPPHGYPDESRPPHGYPDESRPPPHGRPSHPRPPQGYPDDHRPPHHQHPSESRPGYPNRPSHPRPGSGSGDKICIERVPGRKFRTI